MQRRFREPDVSFLLVTSPQDEAVADSYYFRRKLSELGLPFGGFILNRSRIPDSELGMPNETLLPVNATDSHNAALEKLILLAKKQLKHIENDREVLAELERKSGNENPVIIAPEVGQGIEDLDKLGAFGEILLGKHHKPETVGKMTLVS